MTRPRIARTAPALAAAVALALAACQLQATAADQNNPASAPDVAAATTAPADTAPQPALDDAVATRFLQQVHGAAARLDGEWKGAVEGGTDQATYKVCARETATVAGQPALLIAVCGVPDDFGHVTAGLTDFYLVQLRDAQPVAAAKGHFDEFGSMGNAGEVKALRLGADTWGFVVEGGFTGQGYSTGARHVLLPKDGTFVEAGAFRSHLDNSGHMEGCKDSGTCKPNEAYEISFDYHIDDSNPDAALWPIVVREKGNACGKPASAEHRLVPDAAALRYAVPEAAMREGC